MDDSRFWAVKEALNAYASDPDDPPVGDADRLQAAVSVILRGGPDFDLLLIKRASHWKDPWSGHMALPGGRRDPADRTLVATAIRETREETGVELDGTAIRLGRLETVAPRSVRLPSLSITPFVFGVPEGTSARVASREVDAVHWVPLPELRRPGTRGTVEIQLPDGPRPFPCLRVAGDVVWGLTFRILTDFMAAFPGAHEGAPGRS